MVEQWANEDKKTWRFDWCVSKVWKLLSCLVEMVDIIVLGVPIGWMVIGSYSTPPFDRR